MDAAICALSNNEVVIRRKPLMMPLLATALGLLMILISLWLGERVNESLTLMFAVAGWTTLFVGLGVLLRRCFGGEGLPYMPRTKRYLKYEELYFPKEAMREVVDSCQKGVIEQMRPRAGSVPAVVVALYSSEDGRLMACRPFEYVGLEYRPLGELKLFMRE